MFTIKKGTHTSSGGNPPFFLTKLCPFFDLEFSKCSYNRVLSIVVECFCRESSVLICIIVSFNYSHLHNYVICPSYAHLPSTGIRCLVITFPQSHITFKTRYFPYGKIEDVYLLMKHAVTDKDVISNSTGNL